MKKTLAWAAESMQGQLVGADTQFSSISTDTRNIKRGDLFVALRGDNFNGEAFVERAQQQGACAAVVSRLQEDLDFPQIVVADTTTALGRLAAAWRLQLPAKVVAITGSCGKTSVKGMLRCICQQAGATLATKANLNNHIGVPLTLLAADETLDFVVVEAGTSSKGEIAYLSSLIQADVAVVINVHPAHLQGFGTLTAIAEEKAKIYQHLNDSASCVVNQALTSYSSIAAIAERPSSLIFSDDKHSLAQVRASNVSSDALSCVSFDLWLGEKKIAVKLNVPGLHLVENALAAAACAFALGVSAEHICQGLAAYNGEPGRMQLSRVGQASLVDDSYNANPASLKAAIDYLCKQDSALLVLGDMAELGENAEEIHREVGLYAKTSGITDLYAVGAFADDYCDGFGRGAKHFMNHKDLVLALLERLHEAPTILVKGSRSSAMDRVCQALLQEGGQ
ncbi:UDP-N-acetylmuramoyl-tripeptide--D-alanyl-D-alanine ligase [Agaribacterium haliotis]|uniref:UDP-N-acetylmuramoyl-tripeptide--D-alanyl-D- alanine ligase n=1 Tax=Agaribacterium haliotis TaxID=2013869 RepID=UPI000BB533E8|nr:UDP-N-acetylmuramoyl-tripeptide--D-alanyl-D-alanine ligase [Agaribacterium haliotis]